MDRPGLGELLERQSGVVSRAQLIELGLTDNDLQRLVRRRQLVRVHRGVYADHTGTLGRSSRAWAAVLFHWPAALWGQSALGEPGGLVHVAVSAARTGTPLPGVRLHRVTDLEQQVLWHTSPPRQRLEHAVLQVSSAAPDRAGAFAVLADACRQRRTTVDRLREALAGHPRLRHRAWLQAALEDVSAGADSVLERGYLRRVERRHGLPLGIRQTPERTATGMVYRDVHYEEYGVVVELDGRLGHERATDRWADMDRDLVTALDGRLTVRLGWHQVEHRPCSTAERLAALLVRRGWPGLPRPCGTGCPITVEFHAPGA